MRSRTITLRGGCGAGLLIFVCAVWAIGQEDARRLPPHIVTVGESVVSVAPDRARIDIGVVSQAPSSQAAVSQNAAKLDETLAALRTLLGPSADIKTVSYTVQPQYRYPTGGGEPTITGYSATNILRVTIDDLTQVGKAIDAAAMAGANRIQQLQFTLKDERTVQAQALREAAARAREKSDVLANSLGQRVVRILSVSESGQPGIPVRDVAFARTEAASTPIEPGTIEVRAAVTLIVEIAQQ